MPKQFLRNRIINFTIPVLIVLFFVFVLPPVLRSTRNLLYSLLTFPGNIIHFAERFTVNTGDIIKKDSALKSEIEKLRIEIASMDEIKKENERLRALLCLKKRIGLNAISADIIARNPNNWIDSFMVNKGEKDGISKNMPVCVPEGLLGKVVEVYPDTSLVMTVTHPGFKAGGMLKDSRINGIIAGAGGGMAKMMYIPVDADVKIAETVVTSGYSRVFPKGIDIGEVVSVEKSKTGLYKSVMIKPFANSFRQEEVLCIK